MSQTPREPSSWYKLSSSLANALRDNDETTSASIEDLLRHQGDESWLKKVNKSRVASILKLLERTIRPGSTRSINETDGKQLPLTVPATVGRFAIGELVGEGSFGAVHRAFDTVLQRDVAVKAVALRPGLQTADDDYRLNEARAAAKLNHPNLVPLFEVLTDETGVYLVSEFCDGPTLADYLIEDGSSMRPSWAAEITLKLSKAIAYAHGRGLVHRDIKPSNVLLSPERAADDLLPFTPRLTDFGLVLDIDKEASQQRNNRLAGTILYMSPEQIRGDQNANACSGDIYALGLLLYRMLAGKMPYRSDSTAKLFHEICVTPIDRIEESELTIPTDLHAIYLKALEKDPSKRYLSAQEMANDLLRFRDGREVLARPRSRSERIWRGLRGEPVVSSLAATLVCLIVAGILLFGWNNQQLRQHSIALSKALDAASQSKSKAIEIAFRSDMQDAFAAISNHDSATARSLIRQIDGYRGSEAPARYDMQLLRSIAFDGRREAASFNGSITEIASIPGTNLFAIAAESNLVRVYRDTGELVHETALTQGAEIRALAVSPDARWIAVGMTLENASWWFGSGVVEFIPISPSDGSLRPLNLETPQPVAYKNGLSGFVTTIESLAFSPDGSQIAVGTRYEPIHVFNLSDPSQVSLVTSDRRNEDLAFTPDDLLLHSPESNHLVLGSVTAPHSTKLLAEVGSPNIRRLACSPDGTWFAAVASSDSHTALVHQTENELVEYTLLGEHSDLRSLRFSDDGTAVVAGTLGGAVLLWDLATITETTDPKMPIRPSVQHLCHDASVTAIAMNRAGNIISGAENGSIVTWNPSKPVRSRQEISIQKGASVVDLTPDGTALILGHLDGSVERFNLNSGERTLLRDPDGIEVCTVTVEPNGNWAVLGLDNGQVVLGSSTAPATSQVCNVWQKLPFIPIVGDNNIAMHQILVCESGSRICVCRGQYDMQWIDLSVDPTTGKLLHAESISEFRTDTRVETVALTDNDKALLIGHRVQTSNATDPQQTTVTDGMLNVRSHCVDHPRQRVYVGCRDGRIRVLSLDGKPLASSERWNANVSTKQNLREILAITMSPDGSNIITGSHDGEVGIWDAETLKWIGTLFNGHQPGEIERMDVSKRGDIFIAHQRNHACADDQDEPCVSHIKILRTSASGMSTVGSATDQASYPALASQP
ncbi:WD40 repeat domain-containing serine/threonine protein kinase [Rubripirellula reticaptiva]|nr:WD40 repeat domain-containing serine/threonine protein kinase [Rubripirellula reticaptiva]